MSSASPPVLVTGASGAIGRFVLDELAARGHPVVAIDLRLQRDCAGVQWFQCDVRDADAITDIARVSGARRAIHLAGPLLEHEADVLAGVEASAVGSTALFEAARRCGFERVVFASSKAVFGPFDHAFGRPQFQPVREDHPRQPCSVYGLGKLLAEDVAAFYTRRFGLPTTAVRFATTCGPGKGAGHGKASTLSRLVEEPARGRPVVVEEGGDQLDDIIYTADVANALVTICFAGIVVPAVNIGTGLLASPRDVAQQVKAVLPDAQISVGPGQNYMGGDMLFYCRMDTELAQRIGFRPRFLLQDWVCDYIRRIRQEEAR